MVGAASRAARLREAGGGVRYNLALYVLLALVVLGLCANGLARVLWLQDAERGRLPAADAPEVDGVEFGEEDLAGAAGNDTRSELEYELKLRIGVASKTDPYSAKSERKGRVRRQPFRIPAMPSSASTSSAGKCMRDLFYGRNGSREPGRAGWFMGGFREDFVQHQQNQNADSKVKPETLPGNMSHATEGLTFKRCALVGNSGTLLEGPNSYGAAIDKHDVVMRLNQAPTSRWKNQVGEKTDYRVLNRAWVLGYTGNRRMNQGRVSMSDLPTEDGVRLLAARGTYQNYHALHASMAEKRPQVIVQRLNYKLFDVVQKHEKNFRECIQQRTMDSWSSGTTPSTGLMAAYLLASRCNEVHLYGFGKPEDRRKPYQYYTLKGSERSSGDPVHAFDIEYAMLKGVAELQPARFLLCRPNTRSPGCLGRWKGRPWGSAGPKGRPSVA